MVGARSRHPTEPRVALSWPCLGPGPPASLRAGPAAQLFRWPPLGVYPLGNALLDPGAQARRASGLGRLARLSDEVLVQLLRGLPASACAQLGCASAVLRAFAGHEDLWREHCLQLLEAGGAVRWAEEGTWRLSYSWSREAAAASRRGVQPSAKARQAVRKDKAADVSCSSARVYSDVLHRSLFFAATGVQPAWLERECIERADARCLSPAEFVRDFEQRSRPVLLEGCTEGWPAVRLWEKEALLGRFGDVPFTVGPCDLPLREFYAYASNNLDDTPLFVFDRLFPKRAPALLQDYEVPAVFRGRDLFDLLGDARPDFRWLLIGNKCSGSKWHVDPNKTSAWNAVVRGRKRWLLLPPGCPPPGVKPSRDGADVTQPVSLLEWFAHFYSELRSTAARNPTWDLKEVTCGPGQAVFVPCGWWHCVLNLDDDTIAITQNYASETHVHSVRRFLREKREQVSGTRDKATLAERLDAALLRARPDLLASTTPDPETARGLAERCPSTTTGASDTQQQQAGAAREAGSEPPTFSFWDHLRSTGKALEFSARPGMRLHA